MAEELWFRSSGLGFGTWGLGFGLMSAFRFGTLGFGFGEEGRKGACRVAADASDAAATVNFLGGRTPLRMGKLSALQENL